MKSAENRGKNLSEFDTNLRTKLQTRTENIVNASLFLKFALYMETENVRPIW